MEAMSGPGMQHPTVPFYREPTFHVVLGVILAAGGLLMYRVLRARAERRGGPARFRTEAVLVVDLVDSTHLATHYGDGVANSCLDAEPSRRDERGLSLRTYPFSSDPDEKGFLFVQRGATCPHP